MTNNDPDLWDFFVVTTNPENRRQYNYHGEWREFEDVSYELRYRDGNDLKTQPHRARRTTWGPMVPFSSNAVALSMLGRWEGFDNTLRRFRAKTAAEFRAALNPPSISMWNIVYADRQGNIGYQYNAMVPSRDESFDWTKPVPGADPKTKWGDLWSLDDLPHSENPKGRLLANANSTSPLTPLGERISGIWPKYVTSHGPTTRITRLSEILLASRGAIDAAKAKKLATDTQVPYAKAVIAEFKRTPGMAGQDISEPLAVMRKWDGRADVDSKGTALYYFWLRVKGMSALAVKAGKGWESADRTAALTGLAEASGEMRKFHKLDIPWGKLHVSQRGDKTVPTSGFGVFAQGVEVVAVNPNMGPLRDGKIVCRVGSSFRMIADLKPGGIRSWTILPYGNSTDPKSPHYTDQMELFGRGEYKDTRQRSVTEVKLNRNLPQIPPS
jgi:acyl-homoserine lactone acylase PvdQ